MAPIDERTLRREGFRDGVPIALADGQVWSIPRPIVTFNLAFDGELPSFRKSADLGFGADYMRLFERFLEADGVAERLPLVAGMVVRLLRLNYDLADADLTRLLPYRPADPANVEMWQALVATATGEGDPKGEQQDDT